MSMSMDSCGIVENSIKAKIMAKLKAIKNKTLKIEILSFSSFLT
jgi:hypothetical protein